MQPVPATGLVLTRILSVRPAFFLVLRYTQYPCTGSLAEFGVGRLAFHDSTTW